MDLEEGDFGTVDLRQVAADCCTFVLLGESNRRAQKSVRDCGKAHSDERVSQKYYEKAKQVRAQKKNTATNEGVKRAIMLGAAKELGCDERKAAWRTAVSEESFESGESFFRHMAARKLGRN